LHDDASGYVPMSKCIPVYSVLIHHSSKSWSNWFNCVYSDNRVGLWIGIAIGILVIIAVIVIVIVCIVRRYRSKSCNS